MMVRRNNCYESNTTCSNYILFGYTVYAEFSDYVHLILRLRPEGYLGSPDSRSMAMHYGFRRGRNLVCQSSVCVGGGSWHNEQNRSCPISESHGFWRPKP